MPENINKSLKEINWTTYPINIGKTIELCAGIIDKPNLDAKRHIHEEIIEECGYNVPIDSIKHIKKLM